MTGPYTSRSIEQRPYTSRYRECYLKLVGLKQRPYSSKFQAGP